MNRENEYKKWSWMMSYCRDNSLPPSNKEFWEEAGREYDSIMPKKEPRKIGVDGSKLEYRMYGLVPYNLSPIQQGIQYGHAVVEYMVKFRDFTDLTKWAEEDKTFIILNGGTTNKGHSGSRGTLNGHLQSLSDNKVPYATFYEPDLGDQLTAIVFLVDERIWNKEKYPDLFPWLEAEAGGKLPAILDYKKESPKAYKKWVNLIGGESNVKLRAFLKGFRLA